MSHFYNLKFLTNIMNQELCVLEDRGLWPFFDLINWERDGNFKIDGTGI